MNVDDEMDLPELDSGEEIVAETETGAGAKKVPGVRAALSRLVGSAGRADSAKEAVADEIEAKISDDNSDDNIDNIEVSAEESLDEELEEGGDEELIVEPLVPVEDLGTAYDLDDGEMLNADFAEEDPKYPWRNRIETAKEFFGTEILYRYDILEVEDRDKLKGSYRIELKGENGGIWTITLGDELDVVNVKEEAEVVISMHQRDFMLLVNGELNPQVAFLANKIRSQGDLTRAINFQAVLAPAGE